LGIWLPTAQKREKSRRLAHEDGTIAMDGSCQKRGRIRKKKRHTAFAAARYMR
jgi:hypothetical protein